MKKHLLLFVFACVVALVQAKDYADYVNPLARNPVDVRSVGGKYIPCHFSSVGNELLDSPDR